jgi:RNA polymerase sigma-70 factor, ECF subfamily
MSTDLDLALAAARRGEERGFAELWCNFQPVVLRYLRIVVGDAAEAVASRAWLQLAGEVRRFKGDSIDLRVWLLRTARRHAVQELRRDGQGRAKGGDVAEAATAWREIDEALTEAVGPSATKVALQLLALLPADQAEAVVLQVVAGLDASQTAKVLGVRDEAARRAALQGLRNLASIVQGQSARTAQTATPDSTWQAAEGPDL